MTSLTLTSSAGSLTTRDRLDELHEVAGLVELADVRVGDRDLGGAAQVRDEQRVEGDAALVLLELAVSLEQRLGFGSASRALDASAGRAGSVGIESASSAPRAASGGSSAGYSSSSSVVTACQLAGLVEVAELDVGHRRVDPQDLVLDALAALDGEPEDLLDLLRRRLPVRVEDLHQPGEGLVDAVAVAGGDVRARA